jgi:hypothetical protein
MKETWPVARVVETVMSLLGTGVCGCRDIIANCFKNPMHHGVDIALGYTLGSLVGVRLLEKH